MRNVVGSIEQLRLCMCVCVRAQNGGFIKARGKNPWAEWAAAHDTAAASVLRSEDYILGSWGK